MSDPDVPAPEPWSSAAVKSRTKSPVVTMLGFAPLADTTHPHADPTQRMQPSRLLSVQGEIEVFARPAQKQLASGASTSVVVLDQRKQVVRAGRWVAFEKLGLVPVKVHGIASKAIIATYKAVGFGILTMIVSVLVAYIGSTIFYVVSSSWITPTVVSASDDKVVALQTELAAQRNQRDKIAADIHDAERAIVAERTFEGEFTKAVTADRASRMIALGRVRQLAANALATREQIHQTNEEYARTSTEKMKLDYDAHLIDQRAMMGGNLQLAQISTSNLSLAERQSELERQTDELRWQTRSLTAVLSHSDTALTYDVLKIKRDFDTSKLALARAVEAKAMLTASLARQDQMIAGLEGSSYLRALRDGTTVALVPYGNLANTKPGAVLYACTVAMVWCREVGKVIEVLPGEIAFKHPKRDTMMRGQLVELHLDDASAARDDVLFVGGRPLGV